MITVLFAILGGSLGLGYKLSGLTAQAEIARIETEKAGLQDKYEDFRAVQTKEKFLALYLRYMIAKDAYSSSQSGEDVVADQIP